MEEHPKLSTHKGERIGPRCAFLLSALVGWAINLGSAGAGLRSSQNRRSDDRVGGGRRVQRGRPGSWNQLDGERQGCPDRRGKRCAPARTGRGASLFTRQDKCVPSKYSTRVETNRANMFQRINSINNNGSINSIVCVLEEVMELSRRRLLKAGAITGVGGGSPRAQGLQRYCRLGRHGAEQRRPVSRNGRDLRAVYPDLRAAQDPGVRFQ